MCLVGICDVNHLQITEGGGNLGWCQNRRSSKGLTCRVNATDYRRERINSSTLRKVESTRDTCDTVLLVYLSPLSELSIAVAIEGSVFRYE